MKDRISQFPGRVQLIPVEGQPNTYDLIRADQPSEPGTPIKKSTLLSDTTAGKIWPTNPPANPTVDDALQALSGTSNLIGDTTNSVRTLSDDWLKCDGSTFDPLKYPELAKFLGINLMGTPTINTRRYNASYVSNYMIDFGFWNNQYYYIWMDYQNIYNIQLRFYTSDSLDTPLNSWQQKYQVPACTFGTSQPYLVENTVKYIPAHNAICVSFSGIYNQTTSDRYMLPSIWFITPTKSWVQIINIGQYASINSEVYLEYIEDEDSLIGCYVSNQYSMTQAIFYKAKFNEETNYIIGNPYPNLSKQIYENIGTLDFGLYPNYSYYLTLIYNKERKEYVAAAYNQIFISQDKIPKTTKEWTTINFPPYTRKMVYFNGVYVIIPIMNNEIYYASNVKEEFKVKNVQTNDYGVVSNIFIENNTLFALNTENSTAKGNTYQPIFWVKNIEDDFSTIIIDLPNITPPFNFNTKIAIANKQLFRFSFGTNMQDLYIHLLYQQLNNDPILPNIQLDPKALTYIRGK